MPDGGRVVRVAVLHGLDGGGADVFGRREVGFAEAEVEDVDALGLHLLGLGAGGEGGGRLHGGGHLRDRYHDSSSWVVRGSATIRISHLSFEAIGRRR